MLRDCGKHAFVLPVLALSIGCGSGGSSSAGTGGTSAAQGAVGSATIELEPVNPPVAGKACASAGDPLYFGVSGVGPSGTAVGQPLTDGEGGTEVTCSVGSGSDVSFSGLIEGAIGYFHISGKVAQAGTGQATLSIYDPASTEVLMSPTDQLCAVSVESAPLTAGEGRIWASYTCPALVTASNPSILCSSKQGWFYFDQCK